MRWPLREALLAYREHLQREAREGYRFQVLLAALAGAKAPKVPEILKD